MSAPTCWSQLAQELLLYIFSGLNCKTWVRLSGVCRRWRNIILNTPEGRAKRTAFSWMYVTPVIEKRIKLLETTDFNVRVVDIREDIFLVMLKRENFVSNVLIYEKYQDWGITIRDGGVFDGRVTDQFVVLLYHRHLQFYLSAWDRASREIVWTSDEIRIRSPQIAVQNSTILFWNSGETRNCAIEVFVLNEDGTLRKNFRSTLFSPNFLDGNMEFQYPHILMSGGQLHGAWHRATVTHKLEGGASVGVVLVDTGRAAVLPLARVRDGDFALYDTPPAAIRCKLDNKVDSVDRFLDNGRISARVKSFKDNTFIIKLDKKAKKDKDVESVDKVWVVDKQTMGKLEEMIKDLSELETVAMTDLKTGDLCCVRYSEDNELYRAAVTAVSAEDSSVHVTYVDYGNGEVVEAGEVMQLPDRYRDLAPAARRVTVRHAGLALDCERSRARLEKAISGDRVSVAAEAEAGDTEAVSFWVGANKLDLGKTLGWAKEDTINIFHQAESPRLEARVSHAEADTVWLRLEDEELELGPRISQYLQERARRLGKVQGKVQVGDLVVARHSRDRRHYRARVTRQLPGHKLEVLFIDLGDKEVVEVGWLKSLPAELRLCPGLAMPCSLDTSEDSAGCRVVTGAELSRDIGHVTADLVQPRDHVVTLWSRGRRLALVPGGGLAQLPRLRLRLGDTWLGLLCSPAAGGGKQLSIVDVARAGHVRELLEFYRTQVDVSQPVAGHVYCNTVAGVRRRVVVKEGSRGSGGPVTLSELDTGTSVRPDPGTSLETVTPRVRRAAPALVTCQPHVSGGGARYQVPDTLVMVHVADQNTLKLVHLKLRVAPTFLQKDDPTVMCNDTRLTLNCEGENILSVSLPAGVWSSNDLVQVRDALLLASLGAKVHPVTSLPAPHHPLDTVTIAQEASSSGHSLTHNNSFQAKWFQDVYSTRNLVAKCEAEDAGVRVTVHPTLPDILISADTSQDYQLLARSGAAATLRLAAAPALFSLEDGDQLESVAAAAVGDLCLYREEGGRVGRVMVVRVEAEDSVVEVVNVDTGTETVCHLAELLGMTAELAAQPPAVITAAVLSPQTTPAVGAVVRGRVVRAAAGQLELRVLE